MLEYVAVLGLPRGSLIILDGCSIHIQRDDFVGYVDFPRQERKNHDDGSSSVSEQKHEFHWLTIRAASSASNPTHQRKDQPEQQGGQQEYSSIAVGYYISTNLSCFIGKYDPQTEEVNADDAVDAITRANLTSQIRTKTVNPERIIPYNEVLSSEAKKIYWTKTTSHLSPHLLETRSIFPAKKIVPGAYDDSSASPLHRCDENKNVSIMTEDGSPVWFPRNIPVLTNGVIGITKECLSHDGTKKFLAHLNGKQRTAIFMNPYPADIALQMVLRDIYCNSWSQLIGDIQLSYNIFLQISCFNSLQHWRDLVAMLSFASTRIVANHIQLYQALLVTLEYEIQSMENAFFEDIELSENNFLKPSLMNLVNTLGQLRDEPKLMNQLVSFENTVHNKIPSLWTDLQPSMMQSSIDDAMAIDVEEEDDDDDDEAPICVPIEEIEESIARSKAAAQKNAVAGIQQSNETVAYGDTYPVLFAAVHTHEDVLMTCARALDEATDVSLVREAADYLEQVEAKKNPDR